MRELSIFVDESGDFGGYKPHAPFYIFSLVFHDQTLPITEQINRLENQLKEIGFPPDHCFHAGPIIRREEDYSTLSIIERRRCLNRLLAFAKSADISYITFQTEKKHLKDPVDLTVEMTKQLSRFIQSEYAFFASFDQVILYYDNGQVELSKILASVFTVILPQVQFRKVLPSDYRLFQVADLLCTMKLIELKVDLHMMSKSEESFFGSIRYMNKNYLKPLKKKEYRH